MKKLISLIFIALLMVSCSKLTPAPEIIIVNVDPPGGLAFDSTGAASITVTFKNMNAVDAIITNQTALFEDTIRTAPITEKYPIAMYVSANDSISLTTTFCSLPAMGGAASGRTMTMIFTGTDAYGYNKTFSVSTPKICY